MEELEPRHYPLQPDAACFELSPLADEGHTYVYMGRARIKMPVVLSTVDGSPLPEGVATNATLGPFICHFQRCLACGIGYVSDTRIEIARDPTPVEWAMLRAVETVDLIGDDE